MKHILIADAGSTKVDWTITGPDGSVSHFQTDGINALLASEQNMLEAFRAAAAMTPDDVTIGNIAYYGAGCATPEICRKTEQALLRAFGASRVSAHSDLLGAARALLGRKPGIACILGTGSNSCLYDGNRITDNVPALGFILGDEGSGAALGKRLVGDIFKHRMSDDITARFLESSGLTMQQVLDRVYRQPAPNKFLASLVPFLTRNIADPAIHSLVLDEFRAFLSRNVAAYTEASELPVSFIGSIAYYFSDLLGEAATAENMTIGTIMPSPMQGLVQFHTSRQ